VVDNADSPSIQRLADDVNVATILRDIQDIVRASTRNVSSDQ
jgi:hypothetical protein